MSTDPLRLSEFDGHTDYAWELAERGDYADFGGNSRVMLADCRRIAVVQVSDDETNANAVLMHAAPRLLYELRAMRELLVELTAIVRGECPSLLDEDSGGCGRLSFAIDAKLSEVVP